MNKLFQRIKRCNDSFSEYIANEISQFAFRLNHLRGAKRKTHCYKGHAICYCANRPECHDCGMELPKDYTPKKYPELNEQVTYKTFVHKGMFTPKTELDVKNIDGYMVRVGEFEGRVNAVLSYSSQFNGSPHYAVCNNHGCIDVYLGQEVEITELKGGVFTNEN
jgi:hypothetical protein